ncbi:polysaccharide biosynthesis/export family protein [Anaeromyxobacter diazotrophicus]|uniref:polysaccharide biosynthesis/export family protein n=1 Tax=Anaeromyxobacter diazotrophicus TaxID=2590199 RepID=UPI001F2C1B64|nr:polysaccharide biosynthesis/export family protein [Anaeromyxobacter diazotrophicus]
MDTSLRLFAVLALASAAGCALAPGMRLDEDAAVRRGQETTKDPQFKVEPVTQALVKRLAEQGAVHPAPLTDPLAEEAAHYHYRVAPYDVLQVIVWDHPELTAPTGQFRSPEENGNQVHADGTMFYPYVGAVAVAGKTVEEVRQLLTDRIAHAITRPQIDVRVVAFRGKKVQVTGEVVAPTTIPVTDVPLRVQDALALAKGFTSESDFSRVTLSRAGTTFELNLQALYERGDLSQNWLLQDGDVVNVPDRSRNKVFVIGEVRAPQSRLMVRGRMSLAEALADTTGTTVGMSSAASSGTVVNWLDPTAANPAKIYVIRGSYDAPQIYHLDASSPDAILLAAQFPLQPRDVVFVSTYELSRFNRVILQILPTIQGIWQTYDIVQRTR